MSLLTPAQPTTEVEKWVTIDGKRFGAASFEIEVEASIDDVWNELAGNYVNVANIQGPITSSYGYEGEPETGPGAVRHCDINFKGRKVAIDERITDWVETPTHREYTYDVYRSKGFPAKVHNTWSVRTDDRGRTLLRNVFYFRMRPAAMSRPMFGQMSTAARNGVLGYKHFLETGERNPSPKVLARYTG